jgi:hypothetical protein
MFDMRPSCRRHYKYALGGRDSDKLKHIEHFFRQTFNAHLLRATVVTAHNLDGATRDLEGLCQDANQFIVRRSIDRRRGDSHTQRSIVLTYNFAARRSRHYQYPEDCVPVFSGILNQSLRPESNPKRTRTGKQRPGNSCTKEPKNEQRNNGRDIHWS